MAGGVTTELPDAKQPARGRLLVVRPPGVVERMPAVLATQFVINAAEFAGVDVVP